MPWESYLFHHPMVPTQRGHASSSRPQPVEQFVRSIWRCCGTRLWQNWETLGIVLGLVSVPIDYLWGDQLNIPQGPFLIISYHEISVHLPPVSQCLLILTRGQYQPQVRPSGFRWNSQGTYHEQRRHPVEACGWLQTLPNGCDVKSPISCQKMFGQQMLKSQKVQTSVLCVCFKF